MTVATTGAELDSDQAVDLRTLQASSHLSLHSAR